MHRHISELIISQTGLPDSSLAGQIAIITGAGGGIGYEAARALIWLGARVVIAEIEQEKGTEAAQNLIG
jgi:NAD(P)-dependent dehydrogenase (short-subunit alcohol dehydrogenase family)